MYIYILAYIRIHTYIMHRQAYKKWNIRNVTNYYHREFTFGDTNLSRLFKMLRPVYITRGLEIRPCLKLNVNRSKIYERPLPPPPLPQQEPLLGCVCSLSSSTITTLRRVLLFLVRVDFCSASSARSIIRRVRSKNISSMFWFNLADVWKCIAPTCLAYLMKEIYYCHVLYSSIIPGKERKKTSSHLLFCFVYGNISIFLQVDFITCYH